MKPDSKVTFSCGDDGLTIDTPNGRMLLGRLAVDNASRLALSSFIQSISEVRDLSEVAEGESLVCGDTFTSVLHSDALMTLYRKGQILTYDPHVFAHLIREGHRLLHSSPEATRLSEVEMLRDELLLQKYSGVANATILLKKAAAANAAARA